MLADPLLIQSKYRSEGVTVHLHIGFIAVEFIVKETLARKPGRLLPMKKGGLGCVGEQVRFIGGKRTIASPRL